MDEHTISLAGDPFHAVPHDHDDTVDAHYASLERPHACVEGFVYVGHLVEDPGTGEETEVFEAVPCRRCAAGISPRTAERVEGGRPVQAETARKVAAALGVEPGRSWGRPVRRA